MESKKIISGVKWASVQLALDVIFRFSIRLILARLLLPDQFGLIGMSMVFIAVAGAAAELGVGEALIQRKNDQEVEKMYDTAFWTAIGWGLMLYIIMSFIIGPLAAYFYDEKILIKLIPALSIGVLLKPFGTVHIVMLTRKMNFKKIANAHNSASFIAGLTAIIGAFLGIGVWALVLNSVLATALTLPFLFMATKWKPNFEWNKLIFKEIFAFGAFSSGTKIFSTITYNIDNLMIGKILGAAYLGGYTLAFSLTENLRQMVSGVLNKVMYPVFGKNQDDKVKLKSYFLKIVNLNAIAIYPLMAFFAIFAEEIILTFFGEKWEISILPLRMLSIAMMIHLLINSFASIIRGLGKPKLEMKIIMGLNIFLLIPALFIGITYYGLLGATLAVVAHKIALVVTGLIVLNREIGLTIRDLSSCVWRTFIAILVSLIPVGLLILFVQLENIIVLGVVFGLSYGILIYHLENKSISSIIKNLT